MIHLVMNKPLWHLKGGKMINWCVSSELQRRRRINKFTDMLTQVSALQRGTRLHVMLS